MDIRLIEGLMEAIAPVIKDAIAKSIAPLAERLAELEQKGVEFKGVFQRACDYRRGSMVVHDGNTWAAVRQVQAGEAPPGKSDGWQLCARAGRDGKDAR